MEIPVSLLERSLKRGFTLRLSCWSNVFSDFWNGGRNAV